MKSRSLFLLLFVAFGVCGWQSACLGVPPSPGSAGAFPAAAFLAQVPLPAANSHESVMWILAGGMALIVLLGSVATGALALMTFLDRLKNKPANVKAETKASDDGPGRVEFDLNITHLREDMTAIKSGQREIVDKLESFSGAQYKARGRMHRKLNTLENAMHFWAGKLAGQGDPDAKRLVGILDATKDEEGEGE